MFSKGRRSGIPTKRYSNLTYSGVFKPKLNNKRNGLALQSVGSKILNGIESGNKQAEKYGVAEQLLQSREQQGKSAKPLYAPGTNTQQFALYRSGVQQPADFASDFWCQQTITPQDAQSAALRGLTAQEMEQAFKNGYIDSKRMQAIIASLNQNSEGRAIRDSIPQNSPYVQGLFDGSEPLGNVMSRNSIKPPYTTPLQMVQNLFVADQATDALSWAGGASAVGRSYLKGPAGTYIQNFNTGQTANNTGYTRFSTIKYNPHTRKSFMVAKFHPYYSTTAPTHTPFPYQKSQEVIGKAVDAARNQLDHGLALQSTFNEIIANGKTNQIPTGPTPPITESTARASKRPRYDPTVVDPDVEDGE